MAKSQGSSSSHNSPRKPKVTFNEISEIHEEGLSEVDSLDPGGKNKKMKGKIDLAELESGMQKLNRKFSAESLSTGSPRKPKPWEIDPSQLVIGKLVGKGSYGEVYKGYYNKIGVAVKMLGWGSKDTHYENEILDLQLKFLREVEIMYKLGEHPNVCKLLGATLGSTNFQIPSPFGSSAIPVSKMMCCIVMEFMEGGSMREFWIKHRRAGKRRMPINVMVQFALDIARGLTYLHSKKICHRDLKPDNILLDSSGVCKIADFGISRVLPDRAEEITLHIGTPNYTAPEVLAGKTYDYKCDVYSYGICLWEIYACNVPYPEMVAIDTGKVNEAIINKNLRPKVPLCCPSVLKSIMTKCWQSDPSKRPEMAQVVQWIESTVVLFSAVNDSLTEGCACMTECIDTHC